MKKGSAAQREEEKKKEKMQRRKMEEVVRFCFSHFFGLYSLDADYLQFLHVLPFLGVSLSLTLFSFSISYISCMLFVIMVED